MKKTTSIEIDSQEFYNHLCLIQNIINRASGFTLHAKTMAITVISILGAIFAVTKNQDVVTVGIISILVISILDAICLSLERRLRNLYNETVCECQRGDFTKESLYTISIDKEYLKIKSIFNAYKSWSIWLAYSSYIFLILLFSKLM